jgi:hypothetical protein
MANTIVNSSAAAGQSYYSENKIWKDLYDYDLSPWNNGTANFCIKALVIDTSVQLSIPDQKVRSVEQEFQIPVLVKNFKNISKADITIGYDPNYLELINLTSNSQVSMTYTTDAGKIRITLLPLNGNQDINFGSGELLSLTFKNQRGSGILSFVPAETSIKGINNNDLYTKYTNGTITTDLTEDVNYLTHTGLNLLFAIYNEGSIADYSQNPGTGPGIYWKTIKGSFSGGPVFGSSDRKMTNGILPSYKAIDGSLVTDVKNVESHFKNGFTTDNYFQRITSALLNDADAPTPYNVDIIQQTYSNDNEDFGFFRYGYINRNSTPINDFYAGIFMDWDIGAVINERLGGYNDTFRLRGNGWTCWLEAD